MSTLQMSMALQITTRFITGDDIFLLLQIIIALMANHDKFFAEHEDYYKSRQEKISLMSMDGKRCR